MRLLPVRPHPSAPWGTPALPSPHRAEPGTQHRTDPPCVLILGAQGTNSRFVQCFGHTREGGEEARRSERDRQLPSPHSPPPTSHPQKLENVSTNPQSCSPCALCPEAASALCSSLRLYGEAPECPAEPGAQIALPAWTDRWTECSGVTGWKASVKPSGQSLGSRTLGGGEEVQTPGPEAGGCVVLGFSCILCDLGMKTASQSCAGAGVAAVCTVGVGRSLAEDSEWGRGNNALYRPDRSSE